MKPILTRAWKVYQNKLRPQFSAEIIEIQTMDGKAVINWMGFDDCDIPMMTRRKIADHIVALHNASLERRTK